MQVKLNRRQILQSSAAAGIAALWGSWALSNAVGQEKTRDSVLKVLTRKPLNAEPALEDLTQSWMTPVQYFYVRSHAPNPEIDPNSFRLKVEGLVDKPLDLSLAELKERFQKQNVVATMTCAGNRRTEYNEIKTVGGVQWGPGAIGNAEWGGVRLSDVLKVAGLKEEAKHVWFEGLDDIPKGDRTIPFGGSIPVTKAVHDTAAMPGALLSYEMNDQPLTPDHGFPLRSVVPGYIGARSVKWLGKIVVSNRPSPNHYVAGAYKLVTENTPLAWDEAGVLYNYLVNSVIAVPQPNAALAAGSIKARGYALPSGDGSHVTEVQVSANNGKTWKRAKLVSPSQPYCWVLWEADVSLNAKTKELLVRAIDSQGTTQPRTVPWNMKGYMNNSWYDLPIQVKS